MLSTNFFIILFMLLIYYDNHLFTSSLSTFTKSTDVILTRQLVIQDNSIKSDFNISLRNSKDDVRQQVGVNDGDTNSKDKNGNNLHKLSSEQREQNINSLTEKRRRKKYRKIISNDENEKANISEKNTDLSKNGEQIYSNNSNDQNFNDKASGAIIDKLEKKLYDTSNTAITTILYQSNSKAFSQFPQLKTYESAKEAYYRKTNSTTSVKQNTSTNAVFNKQSSKNIDNDEDEENNDAENDDSIKDTRTSKDTDKQIDANDVKPTKVNIKDKEDNKGDTRKDNDDKDGDSQEDVTYFKSTKASTKVNVEDDQSKNIEPIQNTLIQVETTKQKQNYDDEYKDQSDIDKAPIGKVDQDLSKDRDNDITMDSEEEVGKNEKEVLEQIKNFEDNIEDDDDDDKTNENYEDNKKNFKASTMPINIFKTDKTFLTKGAKFIKKEESSNFMTYLTVAIVFIAFFYVVYHNRSKVMAFIVEGRNSRSTGTRRYRRVSNRHDDDLKETLGSDGKPEINKGFIY